MKSKLTLAITVTILVIITYFIFNKPIKNTIDPTQKFAMKRAAELTLERGFDYFLIEGNNVYEKNIKLQSQVSCYNNGYTFQCNEYGGGNLSKPRAELSIRMFNGTTPNQTGYFGAKEFLQYN